MHDFDTYAIALVEPFDLNLARQQAREALHLGRRVVVTGTCRGERCHAFTATPLADGAVHLSSMAAGSNGIRPTVRAAVEDGFGAISRLFRPAGRREIVPVLQRRLRA